MGTTIKLLRRAAASYLVSSSSALLARFATPRRLHGCAAGEVVNPVASQMIGYALSHARSDKSDESYSQGLLVLEQCLSSQATDGNARAAVLLAISTLLHERERFDEAIDRLREVECITDSALRPRVAAMEALVGLHLQLGQDDTSSVVADKCLDLVKREASDETNSSNLVTSARSKAVKGLVELVRGNLDFAGNYFEGNDGEKYAAGSAALINSNVALSYGEYLHSTNNFSLAKEVYSNVVQGTPESHGSSQSALAACSMASEEVTLAANCALGQLYSHFGNFSDAEETFTKALTETEAYYGSNHPKVGIVLTCIALMYRWKAMKERSSSLLVQEGLLRKAIELLKAPAMDSGGAGVSFIRRDVIALARGAYAEILRIQQNRRDEGEKMKIWAESAWCNHRMRLSEALDVSELSSKVPIVDCRISRIL
ncbi:hypothetical protein MLD38_032629 [Melastoma candidum]|uniref:Uncharacterized protein n=1 Tax=Melastoma candidum TaxID=119954 RepID=A0ACB9M680_9MYRT|nr:hypothetical protein MLD38_032629 [Melastoma candidum]